jgi:hypothetical protein
MKRNLLRFLVVFFVLPALGCNTSGFGFTVDGSGNIITKTYDVSDFSRVTLAGFGDVYITQGETESLSVETDDNIFEHLDIRVQGGELTLGYKLPAILNPTRSIIYRLSVKDLNAVTLAGSGNIYSEPLQSEDLTVAVSGSGDVEVKGLDGTDLAISIPGSGNITIDQIEVASVDVSINGSGEIELAGKADQQTVSVNGSGEYVAGDLETSSANISIGGSGNLTVWVNDTLEVRVNGSGDVSYYGRPTVDQTGGGSGNVTSLGEK